MRCLAILLTLVLFNFAAINNNNNNNNNVLATPLPIADDVQILKYENENIGVDGYQFSFETSDGVSRSESASLSNVGTDHEAISVQGTVSWISPDGQHYTLNYLADENGFQPEGDHLPVGPDTP